MAQILKTDGLTLGTISSAIIAGTTTTYTTTVTSAGMINGKYVTGLTAQTNTATPTTDAVTAAAFPALPVNSCAAFVFGQKADSTIQLVQGPILPTYVGVTTTVGAFIQAPQFPALPDNFMVLGYGVVRTAPSASAWTLGTSNWTASGVSVSTFVSCGTLPNRPQIS